MLMNLWWLAATTLAAVAPASNNGPNQLLAAPCKAAVLDLTPGEGVTAERAASLSEIVVGEVGNHLGCTVVSRSEIRALVSFEVERQLTGCDAQSCLSEIGDALGVDLLVLGTIARVESRTLVSLRLVDMRQMTILRRVTDSYEGNDKDGVRWIAWLSRRLAMKSEADAGARPVVDAPIVVERRMTWWRRLAWTGATLSAVTGVVAGASAAATLSTSALLPTMKSTRGADRAQIEQLQEAGPWLAGGANLSLYASLTFAVVAAGLFFLPSEELVEVAP